MDERIIDFEQVAEDGEKLKNYAVELYECLISFLVFEVGCFSFSFFNFDFDFLRFFA